MESKECACSVGKQLTASFAGAPAFPAGPALAIAELARLRAAHPALRRGRQVIRFADERPGLFAVSRFDPDGGAETLLLFDTGTTTVDANVEVAVGSTRFAALHGPCASTARAPGSVRVALPPLGYAICEARR